MNANYRFCKGQPSNFTLEAYVDFRSKQQDTSMFLEVVLWSMWVSFFRYWSWFGEWRPIKDRINFLTGLIFAWFQQRTTTFDNGSHTASSCASRKSELWYRGIVAQEITLRRALRRAEMVVLILSNKFQRRLYKQLSQLELGHWSCYWFLSVSMRGLLVQLRVVSKILLGLTSLLCTEAYISNDICMLFCLDAKRVCELSLTMAWRGAVFALRWKPSSCVVGSSSN